MKYTITYECTDEDGEDTLKIYTNAKDNYLALWEISQLIRSRLKYQNVTEDEEQFLEQLKEEIPNNL